MSKPTSATSPSFYKSICILLLTLSTSAAWAQETVAQRLQRIRELQDPLYDDFEAAEKEAKRLNTWSRTILTRGIQAPLDEKRLTDWAEHRVKMLTNPKLSSDEVQEMTRSLVSQVNKNSGLGINNPSQQSKFRTKVFGILTAKAAVLLKNNYEARVAGLNILGSLNSSNRTPFVPYTGSAGALLDVASNANEVPVLRFLAFMHLNRMNRFGKIAVAEELALMKALSAALANDKIPAEASDAFYLAVAGCIENIRRDVDASGRVVSFTALANSMAASGRGDLKQRSYAVRAVSARAMGLTGSKSQLSGIQYRVVAWKVAELAYEMAVEFNRQEALRKKSKGKKGMAPIANPVTWRDLYDLAVAFRGEEGKVGILGQLDEAYTKGADAVVFPVVKGVMGKSAVAAQKDLDKLAEWLKNNRPPNMKYHPNAPGFPEDKKKDAGQQNKAQGGAGNQSKQEGGGAGRGTSAQAGKSGAASPQGD